MKYFFFSVLSLFVAACGTEDRGEANTRELFADKRKCKDGDPVVFTKNGLTATIKWLPPVTQPKKDAPFEIRFYKTDGGDEKTGPFVDPGFDFTGKTVRWDMPDHGHGTKLPVKVDKVTHEKNGETEVVFSVTNVNLQMIGPWQLIIDFKNSEKDKDALETAYYCYTKK